MKYFFINFLVVILSYIIGSIPFGLIIGKLFYKIDVREHGSHNIGASNIYRTLGPIAGIATLILDFLKGFVPVYIIKILPTGTIGLAITAGIFSILGHAFSIFLKFRGGKAVATSTGVFTALFPLPTFITFIIFVIIVWLSKFVSLGSMLSAVFLPVLVAVFNYDLLSICFAVCIGILVVILHHENIKRLITGKENRFNFKPKL